MRDIVFVQRADALEKLGTTFIVEVLAGQLFLTFSQTVQHFREKLIPSRFKVMQSYTDILFIIQSDPCFNKSTVSTTYLLFLRCYYPLQ